MSAHRVLKALAEPRRWGLLLPLHEHGPLAVGELADRVDVSQQAVSQHLEVHEEADLVEARRDGPRRLHAVRPEGSHPVQEFGDAFWTEQSSALEAEAERP